jgi:hypothetical protein
MLEPKILPSQASLRIYPRSAQPRRAAEAAANADTDIKQMLNASVESHDSSLVNELQARPALTVIFASEKLCAIVDG